MLCPSCGASVVGAFCEYCGAKMPVERVETQSINAENVVVHNHYYPQGQSGRPAASPAFASGDARVSPKSRTVALVLCVLFGYFGAHRFYVRRYGSAVIYLLTLGVFGIGWFIDLVLVALGKMSDQDGLRVSEWRF